MRSTHGCGLCGGKHKKQGSFTLSSYFDTPLIFKVIFALVPASKSFFVYVIVNRQCWTVDLTKQAIRWHPLEL